MTNKRTKILVVVGVLGLAFSVGRCSAPDAEVQTRVKIVSVPTVKTRVVEKEKFVPLPESCLEAVKLIETDERLVEDIGAASGEILDALRSLGLGRVEKDILAINKATERINAAQTKLTVGTNDNSARVIRMADRIESCKKEVANGP